MKCSVSPFALALAALASAQAIAQPAIAPAPAVQARPATLQQESQRPSVLVWMMDDVGFAPLSSFGGLVQTPNIDRMALPFAGVIHNVIFNFTKGK